MANLMKQAQKMQRQMEVTQKEMEEKEYEATAGGGAVTVKVSGKKEVLSVKLSEEVVDPDDIEMLEAVGRGVAMKNASLELKSIADDICDDVANDGIYSYCKAIGLI